MVVYNLSRLAVLHRKDHVSRTTILDVNSQPEDPVLSACSLGVGGSFWGFLSRSASVSTKECPARRPQARTAVGGGREDVGGMRGMWRRVKMTNG